MPGRIAGKTRSVALLLLAELAAMGLWFVSSAILPELGREVALDPLARAALASSVPAGFVVGALVSALLGLPDRFDPRRVVACSAALAAAANALLLVQDPGGWGVILSRAAMGAALAGVYPVGMKIVAGWGQRDRGLLVGMVVGALTVGAALPHALALMGGADWRAVVLAASGLAVLAVPLVLSVRLGPFHAQAGRFRVADLSEAWTNRRVRRAFMGYFGHVWELYAMWAWIAVACAASFAASMEAAEAERLARITAGAAIALGGLACAPAGWLADRIGRAEVTILCMAASGTAALATAASFGGAPSITIAAVLVWGLTIVPDSAQFSALVVDAAPAERAGSLLTLQTALGFVLIAATVQAVPPLAAWLGWPAVMVLMALGPAAGVVAMRPLRRRLARGG